VFTGCVVSSKYRSVDRMPHTTPPPLPAVIGATHMPAVAPSAAPKTVQNKKNKSRGSRGNGRNGRNGGNSEHGGYGFYGGGVGGYVQHPDLHNILHEMENKLSAVQKIVEKQQHRHNMQDHETNTHPKHKAPRPPYVNANFKRQDTEVHDVRNYVMAVDGTPEKAGFMKKMLASNEEFTEREREAKAREEEFEKEKQHQNDMEAGRASHDGDPASLVEHIPVVGDTKAKSMIGTHAENESDSSDGEGA